MEHLRGALAQQYPHSTLDSFVVTNGASEALDLTLRVISSYDSKLPKKVLITNPFYYSYPRLIEFSGMEPVYLKTSQGRIDLDDFKEINDSFPFVLRLVCTNRRIFYS